MAGNVTVPGGDGTVWTDVSDLLSKACEELGEGELIYGENFSFFAAMSALEIMDPKMDSGMDNGKYNSIDEAIESGAAPIPLSPDKTMDVLCVIDVMDHLLSCEATWHKGHSLAQTLFSCFYLLRLDRTSLHPLLHSYCRVVHATCNAVISLVSEARTHEEEDLFTMAFGLPLGTDKGDGCLSFLTAVEETLCRQLRACKAPTTKKMVLEDVEPLQPNLDLEEGFCKALLCRLRFRKHFYHLLLCLRKPQGKGLELARKHISFCMSELERIRASSEFLTSVASTPNSDGGSVRTTASGCQPIGFDPNLNLRSSAPAPPRAIKTLSWEEAHEYFAKLLYDFDTVCSFPLDPSLENILHLIVQFQKSQPDLVARAHLQLLLVQDGKLYGRDPIFSVICRAASLPISLKDHDIQKNEAVVQLGELVINLLKILCTNIAWQRRKLGKILQDWRVIYVQLEMAFEKEFGEFSNTSNDENIPTKLAKHILIWVEEQVYWIALRFLLLGFELDLYSHTDFCMVYWYIYVVSVKLVENTHLRLLASKDRVKKKGKKKRDSMIDNTKDYHFPPAVMLLQCYVYLAEGLTMMLASLRNDRKAFLCAGPFNTEHERFLQHFEHLQKACLPDNITYISFKECTARASLSGLITNNHFKDAQRIVGELKNSFAHDPDRMSELRQIELIAERNSIALNIISRVGSVDPTLKVSFEFTLHPAFAVAIVKRS
ncbi:hypothetical protein Droror1_Dr00015867 [Drosera rotundifolia]